MYMQRVLFTAAKLNALKHYNSCRLYAKLFCTVRVSGQRDRNLVPRLSLALWERRKREPWEQGMSV